MAKSKSFFGLRKGSTKTMTYSVLKGQQITKDRVTDIANPRTMDQTLQRIPFAQAVKFYKQATRGLFRFAFEDKKPLESDYNAFMRHNVKYASSVSADDYRNPAFPSIGNWLLSAGSLPAAGFDVNADNLSLVVGAASSAVTTIGGVSALILSAYPEIAEGDIVTFVQFDTQLNSVGTLDEVVGPVMNLKQFVIDTNSEVTLVSLGFNTIASGASSLVLGYANDAAAHAGGVIFSRRTPSGLRVSDCSIKGEDIWDDYMEGKLATQVREGDAYSWGATDKAILQGAVADESRIQ